MKQIIQSSPLALALLVAGSAFAADSSRFTQIDYPGASLTQAWGINSRGDIVGLYTGADKNNHGFLLNGGHLTAIDYPGAAVTLVNAVSPQGEIVGEFGVTATSPHRGFKLGIDGVYTAYDLPGAAYTTLGGINARGDMAGNFRLADGVTHTFFLSGGQVTKIDYPGSGSTGNLGISPNGEVVGAYAVSGITHGFVWSTGDGFTTIDYPNSTYTNTTGRNAWGDTVGRYLDQASVSHGYVLSNGQFTSIDYPGATFTGLTGIDPDGNISGRCIVNGVTHGFLLRTSKPATRYSVTDLGAVGPPPGQPFVVTNNRLIAGTVVTDSNYSQAVLWSGGNVYNLGSATLNSQASSVNESGLIVGQAEIDSPDPAGEDFCGDDASGLSVTHSSCVPFAAQNGVIRTLRTLGGANGVAFGVNNRGDIVGAAENLTIDPGCSGPQKYQFKPVLWQGHEVEELPTAAGDRNGLAQAVNEIGHAVGASGECVGFNPGSGNSLQPLHALLWEAGRVVDLGNLGGKGLFTGHFAHMINNLDEVVGNSDLKGDATAHAFRWSKIGGMQDLGVLDGDAISLGLGLNDSGVVTGISSNADFSMFRAFLWRGGVMTDMNSLISAKSPLYLLTACSINARGEMIGFSVDAAGDLHGYLATPLTPGADDQFETGARLVRLSHNAREALRRTLSIRSRSK